MTKTQYKMTRISLGRRNLHNQLGSLFMDYPGPRTLSDVQIRIKFQTLDACQDIRMICYYVEISVVFRDKQLQFRKVATLCKEKYKGHFTHKIEGM